MKLRHVAISVAATALAVVGLHSPAGADPSFSVSDTSITAGGSVRVTLDEACLDGEGQRDYGDVISSASSGDTHQETKGADFIKGASGVFVFDTPGTYTLTRFCDAFGQCSQITITVTAPSTTTTSTTTSTTTVPGATTTSTVPGATTTTTAAPATTVPAKVLPTTQTKAVAATPVKTKAVSYTG